MQEKQDQALSQLLLGSFEDKGSFLSNNLKKPAAKTYLIHSLATLGTFLQEKDQCDLYLKPHLPDTLDKYKYNYIFSRTDQTLYFINGKKGEQEVSLTDKKKFIADLNDLIKDSSSDKLTLAPEQFKALITSNGGHRQIKQKVRLRFLVSTDGKAWFANEGDSGPAHYRMAGEIQKNARCKTAGNVFFYAKDCEFHILTEEDLKTSNLRTEISRYILTEEKFYYQLAGSSKPLDLMVHQGHLASLREYFQDKTQTIIDDKGLEKISQLIGHQHDENTYILKKISHKSGDFRPSFISLQWFLAILILNEKEFLFKLPESLLIEKLNPGGGQELTLEIPLEEIKAWVNTEIKGYRLELISEKQSLEDNTLYVEFYQDEPTKFKCSFKDTGGEIQEYEIPTKEIGLSNDSALTIEALENKKENILKIISQKTSPQLKDDRLENILMDQKVSAKIVEYKDPERKRNQYSFFEHEGHPQTPPNKRAKVSGLLSKSKICLSSSSSLFSDMGNFTDSDSLPIAVSGSEGLSPGMLDDYPPCSPFSPTAEPLFADDSDEFDEMFTCSSPLF